MSDPIDREHLAGFSGGDKALEAELIVFFADNAVIYIEDLAAAADAAAWRAVSHKLKGAARSIGALDLGMEAERAEKVCDTILAAGSESTRQQQLDALTTELERVRNASAD